MEVPFPAVTVMLSEASDPMAAIKQSGNRVSKDVLPQTGQYLNVAVRIVKPRYTGDLT